jgi:hypothetical protein
LEKKEEERNGVAPQGRFGGDRTTPVAHGGGSATAKVRTTLFYFIFFFGL